MTPPTRPSLRWLLAPALAAALVSSAPVHAEPLPGQVIQDPDHPQWLRRHQGGPVFLSGFGDPEEFLYFGRGTGPGGRGTPPPWSDPMQDEILDAIIEKGGNALYFILDRSPGHHQPFLDGRAANGADPLILDHMMTWFDVMDENDILINLFFYDDGTGDGASGVEPHEELFWRQVVDHYEHYRNLIWVLNEEQTTGQFTFDKAVAWSNIVAEADDHDHVISTHIWDFFNTGYGPRDEFAFAGAGGFNMWQVETGGESDLPLDTYHSEMVSYWQDAQDGGYMVLMSELWRRSNNTRGLSLLRSNWAFAMAGTGNLWLYPWSTVDSRGGFTPTDAEHRYLREQQFFFEGTDCNTMAPHDELAFADSDWVLADPGRSYIAYSKSGTTANQLGVRDTAEGTYFIRWLDTVSGEIVEQVNATSPGGDVSWDVPDGFSDEVAAWIVLDPDGDGIVDTYTVTDNCPDVANPDQLDTEGDGIGDACDECPFDFGDDADGDTICSFDDNCNDVPNPDQLDADADGAGDACDLCPLDALDDLDADGFCGDIDNCPEIDNVYQDDTDGDLVGDACDPCRYDALDDIDGDGACANIDNCPDDANPLQVDLDGDRTGDACDACPLDALDDIDGDGACADVDNCPETMNADQLDEDGDLAGDACDPCPRDALDDLDADGVCGDLDNCPELANVGQEDLDTDGIGDDCDGDRDGDGVANVLDCAPSDFGDAETAVALTDLRVGREAGEARLSWTPAASGMTDPEAVHEVLVGSLTQLRLDRGFDAACRLEGSAETSFDHAPATDESWYFLVRGVNDCGRGELLALSAAREALEGVDPPACP
ncbi:MAG: thrombospondin type 3 repeat-containing protein [Acidobacteriota bacterium]